MVHLYLKYCFSLVMYLNLKTIQVWTYVHNKICKNSGNVKRNEEWKSGCQCIRRMGGSSSVGSRETNDKNTQGGKNLRRRRVKLSKMHWFSSRILLEGMSAISIFLYCTYSPYHTAMNIIHLRYTGCWAESDYHVMSYNVPLSYRNTSPLLAFIISVLHTSVVHRKPN